MLKNEQLHNSNVYKQLNYKYVHNVLIDTIFHCVASILNTW